MSALQVLFRQAKNTPNDYSIHAPNTTSTISPLLHPTMQSDTNNNDDITNIIIPPLLKNEPSHTSLACRTTTNMEFTLRFQKNKTTPTSQHSNATNSDETRHNNSDLITSNSSISIVSNKNSQWSERYSNIDWEDLKTFLNTNNNTVQGKLTSASTFFNNSDILLSNCNIGRKIRTWCGEMCQLIFDTRDNIGYPPVAAMEQVEMAQLLFSLSETIAGCGLPLILMGKRQMVERIDGLGSVVHAELIENLCYWEKYTLQVRESACYTTFYVCTKHHD